MRSRRSRGTPSPDISTRLGRPTPISSSARVAKSASPAFCYGKAHTASSISVMCLGRPSERSTSCERCGRISIGNGGSAGKVIAQSNRVLLGSHCKRNDVALLHLRIHDNDLVGAGPNDHCWRQTADPRCSFYSAARADTFRNSEIKHGAVLMRGRMQRSADAEINTIVRGKTRAENLHLGADRPRGGC